MTKQSILFTPITIGKLTLPNRWVMPAMQRGMCVNGSPTPELAAYYRRRAEGGISLIIGESSAIDHPTATGQPASANLNAATKSAWAHCVEEVRSAGGQMFLQLWHEGAVRAVGEAVSPSGLACAGKRNGRAATLAELDEIREAYVRSALVAQEVGAAGVEVHAAHGFLLDQFLWHETNVREDGYGGPDIRQRARFPAEVVAAIRAACGPDFIISLRFSQWKEVSYDAKVVKSPAELEAMLTIFRDAGADLFHASTRRFWDSEWEGDSRSLAGWARAKSGLPVITVGSVGLDRDGFSSFHEDVEAGPRITESTKELERGMEAGEFDMVAVGRSSIGDPDFVNKVKAGDYANIRTFLRSDLGQLDWDFSMVDEARGVTNN